MARRTPTDVFAVLADVTKNARWTAASIEGHLTCRQVLTSAFVSTRH